jgi:predicted enzyme related to lactoylglutathione lyase
MERPCGGARAAAVHLDLGRPPEDAAAVPAFTVPDLAAAVRTVRAAGGTSTDPERRRFGTSTEGRDDQGGRFQLVER